MKLVVGLGNPGAEYEKTRHNAGFMVVDALATSKWQKSKNEMYWHSRLNENVMLIKPQMFMNKSGEVLGYIKKKYDVENQNIYVIHDDLDIKLGEYKIQFGKGPKVHNGVNSVIGILKTEQFWRVRVGVENRNGEDKIPGRVYVLEQFRREEQLIWDRVVNSVVGDLSNVL